MPVSSSDQPDLPADAPRPAADAPPEAASPAGERECARPAVLADTPAVPPEIAADDPRLPAMAAEMAARFARYRRGVSTETFEHLVWEAARVRLRWPSGGDAPG